MSASFHVLQIFVSESDPFFVKRTLLVTSQIPGGELDVADVKLLRGYQNISVPARTCHRIAHDSLGCSVGASAATRSV